MQAKIIKNPFILGLVFCAVYSVVAFIIPDIPSSIKIAGIIFPAVSSTTQTLKFIVPVILFCICYALITKENFSRMQRLSLSVSYFIITTIFLFIDFTHMYRFIGIDTISYAELIGTGGYYMTAHLSVINMVLALMMYFLFNIITGSTIKIIDKKKLRKKIGDS